MDTTQELKQLKAITSAWALAIAEKYRARLKAGGHVNTGTLDKLLRAQVTLSGTLIQAVLQIPERGWYLHYGTYVSRGRTGWGRRTKRYQERRVEGNPFMNDWDDDRRELSRLLSAVQFRGFRYMIYREFHPEAELAEALQQVVDSAEDIAAIAMTRAHE